MSILGTFNGASIIALPCDTLVGVTPPSSIEWDAQEIVAANTSPFTGQTQTYDWQASWWEGTLSFPHMNRAAADAWSAFILACRGQSNVFLLGDPKAIVPKGTAHGAPLVNVAGQTGYTLATRGWTPSQPLALMAGDFIQVGYRLYKLTDSASSDSSGHATLSVWPNLRDQPADGTQIVTRNCKGLFRLKQNVNKWSSTPGTFGVSGMAIREAI